MTKVPFFHYTHLDNIDSMIAQRAVRSRAFLKSISARFRDVSIDRRQQKRRSLGLTNHLPTFAGFYSYKRGTELELYLQYHYDDPPVQNPSFYGCLMRPLRWKSYYRDLVILMISEELVLRYADEGRVILYNGTAIKDGSDRIEFSGRAGFMNVLMGRIRWGNLYCEVDLMDDGESCVAFPDDIEAMIVDNQSVASVLGLKLALGGISNSEAPPIFVSELPE